MDIYNALHSDHQQLRRLLERLEEATELNADTSALLTSVRDLLIPHSRAEEEVFYDSIRRVEPGSAAVAHGFEEHAEAETLLRTLEGMPMVDSDWTAAAGKLRHAVNHHIQDEETKIFPAAQRLFEPAEAHQLGEAFVALKPQILDEGTERKIVHRVSELMPPRLRGEAEQPLPQRQSA